MKNVISILLLLLCGVMIPSCDSSDEPAFKADTPTLNPQDSLIVMQIYQSLRLFEEKRCNAVWVQRHPDFWKGVTYEYDEHTGIRYVSGLELTIPNVGDSIPSSIAGLTRLRNLSIAGRYNTPDGYLVPAQLFDCPLETLIIFNRLGEEVQEKLPSGISKVKGTLKELSITNSGLIELPEELAELTDLKICDFSFNLLTDKVPDYFGDFKVPPILSNNDYKEFNWDLIIQGKTIPYCPCNRITNPIPDEILENHYDLFKDRFLYQLYSHYDEDKKWIVRYVSEWRKARNLDY